MHAKVQPFGESLKWWRKVERFWSDGEPINEH